MGGRQAVALVLLVLAAADPCFAEDTFQAEAGLSYSRSTGDTFRRTTAGVDGTYYFDKLPSQPKDTPYEQVQFVERVGSLSASYDWRSSDTDNVERLSNGYDYGAALQFARPDTFFRAAAGFESLNLGKDRSPGGLEAEVEAKFYQASIGAYVAKTTSLDLNWTRSKSSTSTSVGTGEATVDGLGLIGQHLARLPGGGHVALSANLTQFTIKSEGTPTEKNNELLVQATYYPTKLLGLKFGIRVDRGDEDSLEGETYMLGVRTFVTPALSLSLDYQKFNAKAARFDFDQDQIALRAALRF
jgi:putative general porin